MAADGGAQRDEAAPPDPAQQVASPGRRRRAMPAKSRRRRTCAIIRPCRRPRAAEQVAAQRCARPALAGANTAARASGRRSCSTNAIVSSIQVGARHRSGREEHQPVAARRPGCRLEPCAERLGRDEKPAARDVGDLLGLVARAAIRDDHLAHDPGGRARHQRGECRHQRALRIVCRDDDAEHESAPRTATLARGNANRNRQWVNCAKDQHLVCRGAIAMYSIVLVLFTSFRYMRAHGSFSSSATPAGASALRGAGGRIPRHRRRS